jgi:hypothetical protein
LNGEGIFTTDRGKPAKTEERIYRKARKKRKKEMRFVEAGLNAAPLA